MALGTNALASDHDILPDPDSNELVRLVGRFRMPSLIWDGWPIGSKWLLRRAYINLASARGRRYVMLIENYIRDANGLSSITKSVCSSQHLDYARGHLLHRRAGDNLSRMPQQPIELQVRRAWDAIGP